MELASHQGCCCLASVSRAACIKAASLISRDHDCRKVSRGSQHADASVQSLTLLTAVARSSWASCSMICLATAGCSDRPDLIPSDIYVVKFQTDTSTSLARSLYRIHYTTHYDNDRGRSGLVLSMSTLQNSRGVDIEKALRYR